MSTPTIIPVILSGGSGTRLWPLSSPALPKQFHALVGVETLFQQTVTRIAAVEGAAEPLILCNAQHAPLVVAQLEALGRRAEAVVLEPAGRNTAPAVAAAALLAIERRGRESLLLVTPSDHVIANPEAFRAAVGIGVAAARDGHLVTFGVRPDRAETGYGYIRLGASCGPWSVLDRFVEKPGHETAEAYLRSGQYLWNSGMFLLPATGYLDELARHAPAISAAARRAVAEARLEGGLLHLGSKFAECPADSIDYAVMEHTDKGAVVPLAAGWSDIGSWASLRDALPRDEKGNAVRGAAVIENCQNCLVVTGDRRLVVAGLHNTIVVDSGDAVLVMADHESQSLKRLIGELEP